MRLSTDGGAVEPTENPTGETAGEVATVEATVSGLHNPVRGKIRAYTQKPNPPQFRVTQKYGCTGVEGEPPRGKCPHFHRAIDLGNGRAGDPILAAESGIVRAAGYIGAVAGSPYGRVLQVAIDHGGGVWTGYGHLRSKAVKVGQFVERGEQIGINGNSGAQFAHLHFGLKDGLHVKEGASAVRCRDAFWGDTRGSWRNPWPRLTQNQ